MPYSVTCSNKILILVIAPCFILGGVLCEFAHEEEVHYSSWEYRCIDSVSHSSKRFKRLSGILLHQDYCWIAKNTNKEFSYVMMFRLMRPSSTLKFQFVFGFYEYLWAIFSLLNFENFWFYIWVVVVYLWLLILRHKWL